MKKGLFTYLVIIVALISFVSFSIKLYRFLKHQKASSKSHKIETKHINATENSTNATSLSPPHPRELTSPYPFLITPNRYTYIVLTKERKVLVYRDGKKVTLGKRTQRRILYKIKRAGLKDCACHRIKGRRFLCLFKDGKYKEATLRILGELLIVGEKAEKTVYPENLTDFLRKWQLAWMHIKEDFGSYAKLYHRNFKNKYGNLKAWLTYRRANLDKIKYIDIIVKEPVYLKMPSSSRFAVFFYQTYRSNIKRISTLKALLLESQNGTLKIVTETHL